MAHILVIDDDARLCELLVEYLTPEGFVVDTAHDGESGMEKVEGECYDLIVLDVMLPKGNGFDLLRQIRNLYLTPVIMLTARGEEVDRIVGLELGADDYLPKPFNPRELIARIRAVLRRSKPERDETTPITTRKITVGDVEMDTGSRAVTRAGEKIDLTSLEFSLLEVLLTNAGQLVTRENLTRNAMGRALSSNDRSVDVHISKIRKKLGHEVAGQERIKSIRGEGYLYARFSEPDSSTFNSGES